MSTNLMGVFELLLYVARRDNLKQEELPKKLLIISDMEFNSCGSVTHYEAIQKLYAAHGYEVPYLVFWNVNGREGNNPMTETQYGGMVS